MNLKQSNVELIKYNSQKFYQACQLRYKLFFAPHSLPKEIVLDPNQADYFHAAMAMKNTVVAYGQLVPHPNHIYQICQMVVEPTYQRQNLGTAILLFLIQIAKEEGATSITLNARLSAVSFYRRLGFQTYGKQFPSSTTGIPHITMNKQL